MKRPRSAFADLGDKPGHLVRRANQVTLAIFEEEAAGFGVTPAQHVVMTALFRHPGVDQATLAALVALDKVTVGLIVKRLAGRGLLLLADSSVDRRARVLRLAPAGRRLLTGMQPAVQRSQARLLAPLSPAQQRQFFIVMRRVVGMSPPYRRGKA